MFAATVIVGVILAWMIVLSARMKVVRDQRVLDEICAQCGVPERWLNPLAVVELAGAAGVLVGLGLAPLGIAAACGIILYMVLAMVAHVRVGDWRGLGTPMIPLVVAVVYVVLRVGSM